VEKSVNKLQIRITKAVKQNKWHLVKRLEYLLINSYYAKLLAVRKVTQNKGKRTAGIDGIKWLNPESKMIAALSLRACLKIKLDSTIGIGFMHLNRRMVALTPYMFKMLFGL